MFLQPPERWKEWALASASVGLEKGGPVQANSHQQEILGSIEDFFDIESKRRKPGLCECCGSSMQFLNAQFQLYGTPMTWRVRVPFCPACESEVSNSLLSPRYH